MLDEYKLLREALLLLHHLTLDVKLLNSVRDANDAELNDNNVRTSDDDDNNTNST